ncbi:MAG: substrate-binding domain-containing protein [Candidatus Thermoplasmatota archaeon]|nr:substrate-binding domain-containing protein [Candidatus Thermoplasmatota archaeon]
MRLTRSHLAIFAILLTAMFVAGCLNLSDGKDDLKTVTLYGFSVKGEVMDGTIIPAFKEQWKETTGDDIDFVTTYAGSGKITNQVLMGANAEVMILSTEWDAIQLKKGGAVTTDWKASPYNGTVSISPWVILVRKGNPKNIQDFPDLAGSGIQIVHADPLTSGGACWSIFSIYGSELRRSSDLPDEEAQDRAEKLIEEIVGNVISWQSSARNALSQFTLGYGDALITYENEALLSLEKDPNYEIIYPSSTIYSEHKVVIVDRNVREGERELIGSFVDYLFTSASQEAFVDHYFRSPDITVEDPYPEITDPFTVEYLGGWEEAHEELIDGLFSDIRK